MKVYTIISLHIYTLLVFAKNKKESFNNSVLNVQKENKLIYYFNNTTEPLTVRLYL